MNGTNTANNNNGYESSTVNNNNNNNTKNDSNNDLATNAGGDSVASTITATSSNNQSSSNNNNDNSSNNNNNNNQQDDVCRDFLRNVCRRGKSCRYKHPDVNDNEMKNKEPYVFCHDFQNRECRRDNCRFLHCTKQEEEMYRSTGKLPPHIQAQYPSDERNVAPVCKDFLNNTCRRGPRCKYRHPLPANDSFHQYGHHHHPQQLHHPSPASNPVARVGNQFNGRGGSYPNSHMTDYSTHYSRAGTNSGTMMPSTYGSYDGYADQTPPNKRKRYEPQSSMYHHENNVPYSGAYQDPPPPPPSGNVRNTYGGGNSIHDTPYGAGGATGGYPNSQPPPAIDPSRSYMEENAALRRRIDDLKKQVQDLLSTNEYLLEQMNQIRASGHAAVAAACGATSVASLQPQPTPGSVQSTASIGMSAPLTLQAPAQAAVAIGPLPPVSIVSSIASISLPTVSAPVTLVPNSSAAAYTPSMATMHSSNPWPLGVDQLLKNDL